MIPLSIEITNLGAIPYANIDLRSVTLAAIVGVNGAGKSTAFTIAPYFALFGGTKNGCSADDMVRKGTQEMAVTFEFEHGGEVYRVTRTRSTKGKGKSTLELQKLAGTDWVSETGTTIRETEEKIRELLNLDAETFTASSMILQGKANEFTSKPPGQRKGILQQILGLEIYDRLLEKAREKERAANVELEAAKRKLSELEEKLKAKPGLESELAEVGAELALVTSDIAGKETELRETEELARSLQAKAEKARELQGQIDDLNDEIAAKQREMLDQRARQDKAQKMLDMESIILGKAADYERVKEQVTVLKTKQPQLKAYSEEENRLGLEMSRVDAAVRRLVPQIRDVEQLLQNRGELEKAATEYQEVVAALAAMDELAQKWNEVNIRALEAERKTSEWDRIAEHTVSQLETTLTERREQASLLEQVPCGGEEISESCPLITSALKARKEIERFESEIKKVHESQNPHAEPWQSLIKERDGLKYDLKEHKSLRERVADLRPKAEQTAQLTSKAELLDNLQDQKKQLEGQKVELAERLVSVKALSEDLSEELEPLAEMEIRLPKLEAWVKAKDELPAARQFVATSMERINAIDRESLKKEEQVQNLEQQRAELTKGREALIDARAKIYNLQLDIPAWRTNQSILNEKLGGLKAKLEAMAQAEAEHQQVTVEIEPLAKALTRWQTLVKAFGRDGIPALIIENAVPELERIANEILGQMSKGEHSLRFDTQRELKSKSGVSETLDIVVSDWAGDRPYETFSGGEQLRIDFAIRFALAELLARRAGAKIEWLTVDEGLGSQDAEHRGLVLEAIKAVADRFRKTLVITHIEEAQAVFEQRIYFEPQDEGVEIKVA